MENYEQILMSLQQEIMNSKKSLIGGGRAIDEHKCLELINLIRESMPHELTEARYILSNRDDIIHSAQQQANDIINSAVNKANALVYDSEIVKRASDDADNMIADAKEYSAFLESEIRHRINDVFNSAEDKLGGILSMIRDSRDSLFEDSMAPPRR